MQNIEIAKKILFGIEQLQQKNLILGDDLQKLKEITAIFISNPNHSPENQIRAYLSKLSNTPELGYNPNSSVTNSQINIDGKATYLSDLLFDFAEELKIHFPNG